MKTLFTIIFAITCITVSSAQSDADRASITSACMNYLDGFYQGDTLKLVHGVKPTLYKYGYYKNKKSGKYDSAGQMTYEQAKKYAQGVTDKKHFAKEGTIKKVEILDVMNHIAAAKITAWWGVDYVLLSKDGGIWMIEQVLWEGPLEE